MAEMVRLHSFGCLGRPSELHKTFSIFSSLQERKYYPIFQRQGQPSSQKICCQLSRPSWKTPPSITPISTKMYLIIFQQKTIRRILSVWKTCATEQQFYGPYFTCLSKLVYYQMAEKKLTCS